jgi:hypothetical protein
MSAERRILALPVLSDRSKKTPPASRRTGLILESQQNVQLERHALMLPNSRKRKVDRYGYRIVMEPCRVPAAFQHNDGLSVAPARWGRLVHRPLKPISLVIEGPAL